MLRARTCDDFSRLFERFFCFCTTAAGNMAETTGTAAPAAATAPALATTPTTAPATAPDPMDVSTKASGGLFPGGDQPKKKPKVERLVESDPTYKLLLTAVVGTKDKNFEDGLLFKSTLDEIHALWDRLDFVKAGVLKQTHFQTVRGIDPIWESFLDACDVDGDGNIRPIEFVAGFVSCAMEKYVVINMPLGGTVTGFEVMKSIMVLINQHVLEEVQAVKRTMGW